MATDAMTAARSMNVLWRAGADSARLRLSPRFADDPRTGNALVPSAEAVMFVALVSSNTTLRTSGVVTTALAT